MNRFRSLLNPILIVLGILLPQLHIFSFLLPWFVGGMMLLTFSSPVPPQEQGIATKLTLRSFFTSLLLIALTWGLTQLLGWPQEILFAVALIALAPAANATPAMSKMLGGNAVLTLKVFIISHVIACFSIPGVLGFLTRSEISIAQSAKQIFDTIQPLITIPLALAFGLRALYPRLSDKIVELQEYTFALWGASVMLILSKASHDVRQMGAGELWESGALQQMAFVSLFLCLLLYTLGWLWEWKSYHIEGAQSMGQKNTLLVIWISQLYVGPIATLGPVFYVVWQNILLSWLLYKSKKGRLFQSSGKGPRV